MKGMNISCSSQASTAIIQTTNPPSSSSSSSMELKLQSPATSHIQSSSMPSTSSSSSRPDTAPRLLDGSGGGGGRAIDRHNPIVTDGKRSIHINSTTTTPIPSPYPSSIKNTPSTPQPSPASQSKKHNNKKTTTTTKKKNKTPTACGVKRTLIGGLTKSKDVNVAEVNHHQYDQIIKKNVSKAPPTERVTTLNGGGRSESGTRAVSPWLQDYITQPESSRYLLAGDGDYHEQHADHTDGEDEDTGGRDFFDELLRFDPGLKLDSPEEEEDAVIKLGGDRNNTHEIIPMATNLLYSPSHADVDRTSKDSAGDHEIAVESKPPSLPPPQPLKPAHQPPSSSTRSNTSSSSCSSSSDHQVVVLRVSLHCKGCEGKVRKHISRMRGVTSFNIDFAAKKVTVVGDVTPLGVLASISKVKTAQLWTPPPPSSSSAAMRINPHPAATVV